MSMQKVSNSGPKLMQGNEACAAGALAAGCRFMAGYPITPATEIPEYLSDKMFAAGGVFMQMEDELASINAVIGASWGGARAMTATSGPGFTLMQEGIGYAIVSETPLVIVNVMRGGPATGQPTCTAQDAVMQARYGGHGDYEIIALTPSSVQETFDFTVRAFNLADKYRVPVFVLSDETVGHTREKLMSRPKLLMMDEPSLGLAPLVVRDIFSIIQEINKQGVTILLIEQNANMALKIADVGYVLETGRITLTGSGEALLTNDAVRAAYLGA